MTDAWDPAQYERFKADRTRPFHDLVALLRDAPGGKVVDFGCGTGELTAELHRAVGAGETLGIDRSEAMLAGSAAVSSAAVTFSKGDLRDTAVVGPVDVVFSNAALQWVPDHAAVLAAWTALLRPGGQLAVQVPSNADHPSHVVAAQVAAEMLGDPPPDPVRSVLAPERYAMVLDDLGFVEQHVRLQVYGSRLSSSAEVVEWVKGTNLVRFKECMSAPMFDEFVDRYRQRLVAVLGDHRPYFYPFKRVLMWGVRPSS